jgi:hypothetical protein
VRSEITYRSCRRNGSVGEQGIEKQVSAGLDPVTPMHDGTALGYPLPAGRRFRMWMKMVVEIA